MASLPHEPHDAKARLERADEIVDDPDHLEWLAISQRIADDLNLPPAAVLFGPGGDFTRRWPKNGR